MRRALLLPSAVLVGCAAQDLERAAPAIAVSPDELVFSEAGPADLTVSNVGEATLTISSVEVRSGSDFTVLLPAGLPGTLEPGEWTLLLVTWPVGGDDNEGFLDIVSDDPETPRLAVTLEAPPPGTDTDTDTDVDTDTDSDADRDTDTDIDSGTGTDTDTGGT